MPLEYQAGLLQVLQSRTVKRVGAVEEKELDVRVIAATSRNLRGEVNRGHFRGDLFINLNVLRLDVTPLRERPEDVIYVAKRTLDYFNERYPQLRKTMSEGFLRELQRYSWPGNIKELQNCIERVFYASTGSMLHRDDLANIVQSGIAGSPTNGSVPGPTLGAAPGVTSARSGTLPLSTVGPGGHGLHDAEEFNEILTALNATGYHVEDAARHLGMSRASLYRRIDRLRINVKQLRAQATAKAAS
jgi:DNA-binding NtrC family response regulator